MSDNRKYYYLKLKENYFDDDSIVLLESMQDGVLYSNILLKLYLKSLKHGGRLQLDEDIRRMGSRKMRLRNRMQSRPQRKADFLLKMKKAALSVAWGWALRRWPRKEWIPPPGLPIRKYIR